eukprot:CAMPEP_0168405930 /NCGR_PEP_ID=MMETSP0228-20121227/25391_1 /TAXON_ID=133427 /ORGANISM="Protoceratium reticulatum, Strain CCCM 535 (=CCMP 1889)" /LENGTH=30 /DNA_ID= /DNA_START= /DNA_END= /DNA_ORIENTATION=
MALVVAATRSEAWRAQLFWLPELTVAAAAA